MRAPLRVALALAVALVPAVPTRAAAPVIATGGYARIKDVASLKGVRDNQIVGYGLVTGLQGTGDTLRNAQFTEQSLQSMLDRMGINVRDARPAHPQRRRRDGDGRPASLRRRRLAHRRHGDLARRRDLLARRHPADDAPVRRRRQRLRRSPGAARVSGFSAQGQAEQLTQGVPTAGRIPNGALIEREVPGAFRDLPELIFELKNPDFKTATMVADAINAYAIGRFRRRIASPRDQRSVVLQRPRDMVLPRLVAEIGDLTIQPDVPARVVVDQRTGTVVIGRNVQISTVAVTHGNLTVRVTETPEVSQPAPFSNGQTTVVPRTEVAAREEQGRLASSAAPTSRPWCAASTRSASSPPTSSRSSRR